MKKKGFSLIEITIVLGIISILLFICMPNFKKRYQTLSVIQMKTQIPTFVKTLCDRSFDEGRGYKIIYDFDNYKILVMKGDKIFDELNLAKNLKYQDKRGNTLIKSYTTDTGNFGTMFSLYILSSEKDEILGKISIRSVSIIKYGEVRVYKPKGKVIPNKLAFDSNKLWEREL